MEEPLTKGAAALELIPQKPPFVLVDTLISATADIFRSEFTIPSDHILVHLGTLLDAGIMENAAQTAALGMGHLAKKAGAPPPLGFIGAISKLEVLGQSKAGQRIETTVIIKHTVMSAHVLEAVVEHDGTILARMELKVFLIDDDNGSGTVQHN